MLPPMSPAFFSSDDSARLQALDRYGILDTEPEAAFDDLTQLAAHIFVVPIALVSLVDAKRQWFKSKVGLHVRETPKEISFCIHAIQEKQIFEVPDALQDARFRTSPLVTGDPRIRFYAGAPLATPDGQNIGTLCLIDRVPRRLTTEQREILSRLARQVMTQLEFRRTAAQLAQEAVFQQTILNSAASAVIAATPDGVITHFNPAAEQMLGYTKEEMIGKLTPAVFHDPLEVAARAPDLSREVDAIIAPGFEVFVAKARTGQPETREWTYVRKDGSRFPVLLSVSALRNDAGEITGFLGIARDITERKHSEAKLQAARLQLAHVLEGSSDGFWDWDIQTGNVRFSERWAAMLGYALDEIEPHVKTWEKLVHPDDMPQVMRILTDHLEGRTPAYRCEHRLLTKQGEWRWILDRGKVVEWDAQGKPLRAAGTHTDIHAQKMAEFALRESEQSLAITLNSIGDAVLSTDQHRKVLRMNPIAERLTGWPLAEALGRSIEQVFRIINEETRQPASIPVDDVLATGEVHGLANHTALIARDGREIPIADSAAPLRDVDGHIIGVVLVFRDVTDERRAERLEREQREQTASFQSALLALRDHEDEDLPEFFQYTADRIAETLGTARVSIWLFDETHSAIVCKALFPSMGHTHESGARLSAADYPVYFQAISNHESILADDARTHPATREFTASYLDPLGITSMLDLPIRVGGTLAGVLCCEHTGPARQWTQEEHKFAMSAASYVMLALEQAERRKAEQVALDNEKRYRALIHSCRDAMMTVAPPTWRFTSCNPAALALFGVKDEAEFLALGPWDLSPTLQPDGHPSIERAKAAIDQAMRAGMNFFEWTHQRKDGRLFAATVLLSRVDQGDETFIQATVRDITEQKQVAVDLQRSRDRLEQAMEVVDMADWEFDVPTRLFTFSDRYYALRGTTAEREGGYQIPTERFLRDFVHPHDVPLIQEAIAKALAAPDCSRVHVLEYRGLQRDTGAVRDILVHYRVECDEAGCAIRGWGADQDVTERKRIEQELFQLNHALESRVQERTAEVRQALATLDATEDGAFIFDPKTLRFSYVNQGAMQQLGYSREELLTMTPVDIDPEFDEAGFRDMLAPMLGGEIRKKQFTTQLRHQDDRRIPVEINLQYITAAGEPPCFIAIVRDITERIKIEKQASRSQRLESLGTLAGGVAHDLNNALAPILMGVELLKLQYPKESKILDLFEYSARRGADMVRQLLTFARGTVGERVSLQPVQLFKELQTLIQGSFPKNIQLVVKCDPNLPTILGDATQLHQILLNLCVNARDAMPHGGILTLEAQCMEVDTAYASFIQDAKPGTYVVLRVRDTGTGIPPEILDRIFDPFFTTKNPEQGTGLGLSTVMGIVKGHRGFLQVYSQPAQGSTFAVYLPPDHTGGDTELVPKAGVEFRGRGEMILFVDDEAAVREMARAVLERLNFQSLIATDGADGLMQATEYRAELRAIVTDLHMPHMDGLVFVRALRRMLPDIPVVVASGRMEEAMAAEFQSLGVVNRLDKPFTEFQLAEALRTLLASQ